MLWETALGVPLESCGAARPLGELFECNERVHSELLAAIGQCLKLGHDLSVVVRTLLFC